MPAFIWLLSIAVWSACPHIALAASNTSPDIELVASTPGDKEVKELLSITPDTKVDFIRWRLTLSPYSRDKTFTLVINFGEAQPNTLGFKNGGENRNIHGTYNIIHAPGHKNVYVLQSSQLSAKISLLQLSDNLFHLLTSGQHLMIGNGGWSYTLNRSQPLDHAASYDPALISGPILFGDTARQIIFEGRTPCLDLAKENNISVVPECFKLKWKLTLNRDPKAKTAASGTYLLNTTNTRHKDVSGRWTVIKKQYAGHAIWVLQLDPDLPGQSISLLLPDENIALFLHNDNTLFTGNADFSYTLNRRR